VQVQHHRHRRHLYLGNNTHSPAKRCRPSFDEGAKRQAELYRRVSQYHTAWETVCLVDGGDVSVDPPNGGERDDFGMAGALCGHVRRHPSGESPANSTVFAMYMAHEVKDGRTEPWWELDSSSWAGGWTPCGSTGTRRESRTSRQVLLPHQGRIPTLLPRMGHRKQDPRAGRWQTTAGAMPGWRWTGEPALISGHSLRVGGSSSIPNQNDYIYSLRKLG
jgi:hypothetical protein